ncbi:Alpha/Beta hydrolase protein [Boletus edulis BED1]|uniref:carboxypeptidase C n=1 Tax=Boletus edulis BED1 TaxID=1328754 RepID=A0AAD4BYI2_BOLED|nr:Alpha/Beta hydrolase protein [Boletus edulis BED1]
MFLGGLGFLSLAILSHASLQSVLAWKQPSYGDDYPQPAYAVPYDDGLFTPFEHLSALSVDTFTTLGHPYFPNHSVRIKKTDFCDKTVNSYTGYIDIEARHLFFYFFESRNDPATDDVIFWTNGGPGCSSSLGLFMELGPCRALTANGTTFHPESWNTNANIFFVDQPVGVGFSYADYGEAVSTTEEAAKDIAAFVAIFFENFSQFKDRAFHMAGESYGVSVQIMFSGKRYNMSFQGRYIPVFAAEVYDQNVRLVEAGMTPINLQSVMIGNGIVDFFTLIPSYIDMQCTAASLFPTTSISTCVRMKQALPRCQKWLLESCINQYDALSCGASSDFCDNEISGPYLNSGMNPYDMSKKCEGDSGGLCYSVMKYVTNYLDLPATRTLLGVDPSVTSNFSSCNDAVFNAFTNAQDGLHETYTHISGLLERGVRALIYVGTYDWICNWIGNERWTLKMPWTGQEAFVSQSLREWEIDGQAVGKTRSANGLTFATIDGAGHMVPYDKPKEALVLVQKWLAKEAL